MKLNIAGFDAQIMNTKSGDKLLVEVGDKDITELDKFVREHFNVRTMIESTSDYDKSHDKMICYILKD